MKNISYIINGVLAVAIIVLFILFFTSNKGNTGDNKTSLSFTEGDSTGILPIAYVNVDSLLINYNYAKDANDALMKKYNSSNATLTQKQRQLQSEGAEFQRKVQNNAFLSQERMQQEAARIQKIEVDLNNMAQKLQEDYMIEQQRVSSQMGDSLRLILKEINNTANYQMILSNTGMDNVLFAKDGHDITQKVINLLNSRYKSEASK